MSNPYAGYHYETIDEYTERMASLNHAQRVDELVEKMGRLFSGGGGDYGCYAVADVQDRIRILMHMLLPETGK